MVYLLSAFLNLIPGFGLGYLLLGRHRAFKRCLYAFVGITVAAVAIARLNMTGNTCVFYSCGFRAWASLSVSVAGVAALGLLNFPTALHLAWQGAKRSGEAGQKAMQAGLVTGLIAAFAGLGYFAYSGLGRTGLNVAYVALGLVTVGAAALTGGVVKLAIDHFARREKA